MSTGGNGQPHLKVSMSQEVANNLKQILKKAASAGIQEEFVGALRAIHERLQHDPEEFGEQLYFLKALGLQVRTGAIWPLSVTYGVNVLGRLVFIGMIKSLKTLD
jgi:hypothetical protein